MPQHQFQYVAEHAFPRRTALWYYRLANVVWLWIVLIIVLGFVQWRIDPLVPQGAFDARVHDQTVLWLFHLLGLVSALLLGAGVWFYLPRLEILGHVLLAAFITMNAVALIGFPQAGAIAFITTISIGLASACRCYYLIKFSPQFRRGI